MRRPAGPFPQRTARLPVVREPVGRRPAVPWLEAAAGGVWWVVGAAALAAGAGTVVLAAGLGGTGALLVAVHRRHGPGAPLTPADRTRLLRLLIGTVGLVVLVAVLLGLTSLAELSVPLACAIVGAALFPLASLLDERSLLAAGGALLLLGAVGALLALDSAGRAGPQGVVGLVAGAVLWAAAAYRAGLLAEARARVRR